MSAGDDERVLDELVERAGGEGRFGLLQFRTRVSARQYAPVYAAFRDAVPAAPHVLDWGAGNGHFAWFLARSGFDATAFAFAPPALATTWGEGGPRSVVAEGDDPVKLPFADGAFDAVCSIGVLEHVAETGGDEDASLDELARVLAPGGVLFVCHLPTRGSWVEWLARHAPVAGVHHHPRRFGAREIPALLGAHGFRVERAVRYGFLPRNGWHRLPRLGASRAVADLWDGLDRVLGRALPWLCTNWLVVARKRDGAPAARAARA